MKLILGLGNPEEEYAGTRHNFGFRVLDAFREQNEFSEFKLDKKFRAETSEGKVGSAKVLLVKPQTFVNLSGEAARALLDFYKPHIEHFIVVHDDI
ncbi:MAG: aminoacyl-tRNA hydrolase, partial [Patescibacteria group bacterium]